MIWEAAEVVRLRRRAARELARLARKEDALLKLRDAVRVQEAVVVAMRDRWQSSLERANELEAAEPRDLPTARDRVKAPRSEGMEGC